MPPNSGLAAAASGSGVRVERAAGEVGEVRHVLVGDGPRVRHDGVPDAQLGHRPAERMDLGLDPGRARRVDAGDRREHVRRALHGGALHTTAGCARSVRAVAAEPVKAEQVLTAQLVDQAAGEQLQRAFGQDARLDDAARTCSVR